MVDRPPAAMTDPDRARRRAAVLALILAVIGALVIAALPPVAQPPEYHDFVDTRPLLGVPNGADVLSNVGFLVVGLLGLGACLRRRLAARPQWLVFFLGVALTAFGSAWYHLAPDNPRLVWDRLPMTLGFMGLLAAIVGERLEPRLGRRLLAPLLALGLASVLYWIASEARGAGDLRPYAAVQFLSLLVMATLLLAAPGRRGDRAGLLWAGLGCYALAKLCEALDRPIFALTGELVSGHTLKHLIAAVGVGLIARMIARRRAEP